MARRRAARERAAARQRRERQRLIIVVGVLAIVAVAALILVGGLLRSGDSTIEHVAQREGRVLGSATAPVTISLWEDFQCPVCKMANATVIADIEKEYVSTGKAKIEFKHFPFLGAESLAAAEGSECAAEVGHFWEYHDALFQAQSGENRGTFSAAKLRSLADDVGLDAAAFGDCLDSDRYRSAIQDEKREGEKLGVSATPTIFVNGKRVLDWRSYSDFADLIEQALSASR